MFVAAAYVLLQIAAPGPASRRFGLLNLIGIGWLFGPEAALSLAGVSIVLWGLLAGLRMLPRPDGGRLFPICAFLMIIGLGAVFVGYKYIFDAMVTGRLDADAAPIGLGLVRLLSTLSFSYVFLRCVDLTRSVAFGEARLLDPLALAGYLGPFHMLLSGPISSYYEHLEFDDRPAPEPTFTHLVNCASIITTGLFMKVVIAQAMKIFLVGVNLPLKVDGWWDAAYLLFYLYFDFAGYSLIALGIGKLLGVPTPLNFRAPFLSSSVTDFWSRWHISLGTFVRNNIYLPMQLALARRCRNRRRLAVLSLIPTMAGFLFVAMWHRMTMAFLIWGVAISIILVIEKVVFDRVGRSHPEWPRAVNWGLRGLGIAYTFAVIATSVWFFAEDVFTG